MNYEKINQAVLKVYEQCSIKSFPIDCFGIFNQLGLQLITYNDLRNINPELYQIARRYSDDAFKYRMAVYYNSACVLGRIRFSLMHELGHHVLGHTSHSQEQEDEADYFASCMLAPRVLMHYLIEKKDADSIHDFFGLSYTASNSALMDYRRWIRLIGGQRVILTETEQKLYELFTPEPIRKHEETSKDRKNTLTFPPIPADTSEKDRKRIERYRREKRKIARQMAEYEKRQQFLLGNVYDHDDFQLALDMRSSYENHYL